MTNAARILPAKGMTSKRPGYITLCENGEIYERISVLEEMLSSCTICPRSCGVDRTRGELGVCRIPATAVVSAAHRHYGEEPPLVGSTGSGTIFMTGCNLSCVFCQNAEISQDRIGDPFTADELAHAMVRLAKQGCNNINFVTPTHQVAAIVAAIPRAVDLGLELPLVYNTGGYDSVETLKLLDGIFDIYMPDLKYADDRMARKYSGASDYVERSREAAVEMHRQVGDLVVDARGVAVRGMIIRHLVMPGGVAGTADVARFIAEELSPDSYVNIMDQYRPCHHAGDFPEIDRRITPEEFERAIMEAREAGLTRLAGFDDA